MLASEALQPVVPQEVWAKINKNGPVPDHVPHLGQCWEWTGSGAERGYGTYRNVRVHRLMLQAAIEQPLGSLFACHKCDNPRCCNPDHLFAGTHTDNMRDMSAKGRDVNSAKTHCINGHEYTPENTITKPSRVGRICRICQRKHHKHYMRRRLAAKRQAAREAPDV